MQISDESFVSEVFLRSFWGDLCIAPAHRLRYSYGHKPTIPTHRYIHMYIIMTAVAVISSSFQLTVVSAVTCSDFPLECDCRDSSAFEDESSSRSLAASAEGRPFADAYISWLIKRKKRLPITVHRFIYWLRILFKVFHSRESNKCWIKVVFCSSWG